MAAQHVMKALIPLESLKEAASAGQAVAQSCASAVKSGLLAAAAESAAAAAGEAVAADSL